MTTLNQLIKKQIDFSNPTRIGTVMTALKLKNGSTTGDSPVYVVNVDIGSNRLLEDVIIKAAGNSHFYAQVGTSVLLQRNTRGLFDIIGPADRAKGIKVVKTYDFGVAIPTATANSGFQIEIVPYSYYQGLDGSSPTGTHYGSGNPTGTGDYNLIRTLDGDGNPI